MVVKKCGYIIRNVAGYITAVDNAVRVHRIDVHLCAASSLSIYSCPIWCIQQNLFYLTAYWWTYSAYYLLFRKISFCKISGEIPSQAVWEDANNNVENRKYIKTTSSGLVTTAGNARFRSVKRLPHCSTFA